MTECWLKPNPRPTYAAMGLAGCMVLAGGVVAVVAWRYQYFLVTALGCSFAVAFVAWGLSQWKKLRCPRVSYAEGVLLVHDGSPESASVPIDVVEAFFLGSGPALGEDTSDHGPRTANVVIRIAESAGEWHEGELMPAIGKWSEGYIVLRGTWCEPIGHERLNVINRRLAEVHRQRRQQEGSNQQVTA